MVVKINGVRHYLWRAVDQDGIVLDVLVQPRRDARAAKKFFRKLLQGLRYTPRVLVTDKLGSSCVAHRQALASAEHRRSRYLNNRAENSHQPTRVRERVMKRFASPGQAQRFCSAHGVISSHFRVTRHLISGTEWRAEMTERFTVWNELTGGPVRGLSRYRPGTPTQTRINRAQVDDALPSNDPDSLQAIVLRRQPSSFAMPRAEFSQRDSRETVSRPSAHNDVPRSSTIPSTSPQNAEF